MKITPSLDFTSDTTPVISNLGSSNLGSTQRTSTGTSSLRTFTQMLQKVWRNLALAFNGNISFGDGTNSDNISGVWETVTFGAANTDVTITHNLGRVPVGYITMMKSQAGDIYTGSVAANKTQITLRCSTAGMTASLFIL